MCLIIKYSYKGVRYKFTKKQVKKVLQVSEFYKNVLALNEELGEYKYNGCIKRIKKEVSGKTDLNKLTPNKVFKELLAANEQIFLIIIKQYEINLRKFNDYRENLKCVKRTGETIKSSIQKISPEKFEAIENYLVKNCLISPPIEPYISLIVHCFKYDSTDKIDIPIVDILNSRKGKNIERITIENAHKVITGVSVTGRIAQITQPYNGYLPVNNFVLHKENDGNILGLENIHPSISGLCVDYLSRFMCEKTRDAFNICFLGAKIVEMSYDAEQLFKKVKGLDDTSIICAAKLCGFDVAFRAGREHFKDIYHINPDQTTINNIRIMVQRSLSFFNKYGPVTKYGFTFENGGYTRTVCSGDGDFLTKDTMWDFKTISGSITSKHTLQLLMYYIMGKHSKQQIYDNISFVGFFNPRKNEILKLDINKIDKSIITQVEKNVICY